MPGFSTPMTSTSSTIASTDHRIWIAWTTNVTSTTSVTLTNSLIWTSWNAGASNGQVISNQVVYSASPRVAHVPPPTPEQLAERAARAELYRQEQIRVEGERAQARDRAERLLHDLLSAQQLEELKQRNWFHLETVAASGERRRYRIERGRSRNVRQVDDSDRVIKTLCLHPVENVPDADTMVAQMLWLQGDEQEFLRVANHS